MVAVTNNYYHKHVSDNSNCDSSGDVSTDINQSFNNIESSMEKLDKNCASLAAVVSQIEENRTSMNLAESTDTADNDISSSIEQLNMLHGALSAMGSQEDDNDIVTSSAQSSNSVDDVILKETDFSECESLAVLLQKLTALLTEVQKKNANVLYDLRGVQAQQSLVQLKNFVDKSLESAGSQFTGSILSAVGGAVSGLASAAGNMVTPQVELGSRQGFAAASLGGHVVAAGFNIIGASYQAKASKQKTDSDVRQSNAQQLSSDASASTQKADASRDSLASLLNQLLQGLQGVMSAMATR